MLHLVAHAEQPSSRPMKTVNYFAAAAEQQGVGRISS